MKLLTTRDKKYLVWVSEEAADREQVWVYYRHSKHKEGMVTKIIQFNYSDYKPYEVQHIEGWGVMEGYKKLLGYLPLTPDTVPLDGVPLLPPLVEEDPEQKEMMKAFDTYIEGVRFSSASLDKMRDIQRLHGFRAGWKAKAASGERKYSEEDLLRRLVEVVTDFCKSDFSTHDDGQAYKDLCKVRDEAEDYIQSLSPAAPLPVAFEADYYCTGTSMEQDANCPCFETPGNKCQYKTITLPDGQEQLVGRYKYKEDSHEGNLHSSGEPKGRTSC